MCGFDGARRSNYFGGEPLSEDEVEVRNKRIKNAKTISKDEITGGIIKGGSELVIEWVYKLCNMTL